MRPAGVQQSLWTPLRPLSQPPSLPSSPCSLLLVLYKQPCALCHPSLSRHKGGFYQYVLVTFRGQCCCSWTLPAGSQKSCSVSEGHYVCLLCVEECQVFRSNVYEVVHVYMDCVDTHIFYRFVLHKSQRQPDTCAYATSFFFEGVEMHAGWCILMPLSHIHVWFPMLPLKGSTRTRCPIVNLVSRFCSIVIEVTL